MLRLLALVALLAVVSSVASGCAAERADRVQFSKDSRWRTVETTRQDGTPVAWIANIDFATEDEGRVFPDTTIKDLPPRGIVMVAVGPRPYTGDADFNRIDLPVTLSEGRVLSEAYEGKPAPHVSYFFADTWVGAHILNVWGYIGENPPTAGAEKEANEMLAALRLP